MIAAAELAVALIRDCRVVNVSCDTSARSNSCSACGILRICRASLFPYPQYLDRAGCCQDLKWRKCRLRSPAVSGSGVHVSCGT